MSAQTEKAPPTPIEVKVAREWVDALADERVVQIHRWITQKGSAPPPVDPQQLSIFDALADVG